MTIILPSLLVLKSAVHDGLLGSTLILWRHAWRALLLLLLLLLLHVVLLTRLCGRRLRLGNVWACATRCSHLC